MDIGNRVNMGQVTVNRGNSGHHNLTTLFSGGVTAAILAISTPAHAAFRLNTQHLERDITLIMFALITLAVFYFVRTTTGVRVLPLGRRAEDLETFMRTQPEYAAAEKLNKKATETSWDAVSITGFPITLPTGSVVWTVTVFSTRRLAQDPGFEEAAMGLFLFAEDSEAADEIITPIMRKIYARYKHQFEITSPISVLYSDSNEEALTWVPNEAGIRNVLFRFLDECLTISNLYQLEPCLTICRGATFWVAVTWPEAREMEFIHRLWSSHKELELIDDLNCIGLKLHLSFPKSQVLGRKTDAEKRSA